MVKKEVALARKMYDALDVDQQEAIHQLQNLALASIRSWASQAPASHLSPSSSLHRPLRGPRMTIGLLIASLANTACLRVPATPS